ncbi:MAG: NAD-dependent protein deacylase [Clostridia bacterium]|nr:NAD-dependent protein deacylase [Clostridia bacterium]
MEFEERISELKKLLDRSKSVVFFGGAGVSTDSGIPDFRSKDGLYNQHDVKFDRFSPEYLLSNDCLYSHSNVFFEFYRQKMNVDGIEPNITHKKLAELEKSGKLSAVITQNIDGLHQKAGSKKVYEVHGTTLRNYCDRCHKSYPSNYIFSSDEAVPHCTEPNCKGMIRPDVTLYGESLPNIAWEASIHALSHADLLIIGGTSGVVYPANTLVKWYKGNDMVIINKQETTFDRMCSLVFHESLSEVFGRL